MKRVGRIGGHLLLYLLCTLVVSCGYRFSGGGQLPGGTRRIAVEVLENRSAETGIEVILTNDIINELIRKQAVKVTQKPDADAVLSGVIRSAGSETVSHLSPNVSAESRITVVVDLKLITRDGNLIWSARGVEASEDYTVSEEKIRTEQNKRSAVINLSERLAQRIYFRLTEKF